MIELPVDRIRACVSYDPDSGSFLWRHRSELSVQSNARFAGKPAGYTAPSTGYLYIRIDGHLFKAHRLAWVIMTGKWPEHEVDHINCNKSDNRWVNLREATKSENMRNRGPQRNNTSGFKGVCFCKSTNRWRAMIQIGGRNKTLGRFDTREQAHAAYSEAAEKYHGEFARAA